MPNTSLVDVCMITYAHEPFLRQTIESILMQKTDFPFRLVIGEDCSPDSSRAICEEYAQAHPERVVLLPSDKNWGAIPNFERTIAACTAPYIAFCEGDDYWTDPNKLQKQWALLEANKAAILCFHEVQFLEDGAFRPLVQPFDEGQLLGFFDLFDRHIVPNTSTVMVRKPKEAPKRFAEVFNGDTLYFYYALNFGKALFSRSILPSTYRLHAGGIFSSLAQFGRREKALKTYRILAQNMQEEAKKQAVEALLLQLYREYLILALKEKALGEYLKKKWAYFGFAFSLGQYNAPWLHLKDLLYHLSLYFKRK